MSKSRKHYRVETAAPAGTFSDALFEAYMRGVEAGWEEGFNAGWDEGYTDADEAAEGEGLDLPDMPPAGNA
jgi:flagellar biosynthesis/type III secretory pathway protein FliH